MLKRFGLTPVMRRDRALEWQAVTAEMITRSLPLVAWWFLALARCIILKTEYVPTGISSRAQ